MYRTNVWLLTPLFLAGFSSGSFATCEIAKESTFRHDEIGAIAIFRDHRTDVVAFSSQMQVNTDGAPDSYHPDDIGITHICNGISVGRNCEWKASCLADFNRAKAEGFKGPTKICCFAMATTPNGEPIIQGALDPKPGYFVSTTALRQPGEKANTPQAQLDSNTTSFAVIPKSWHLTGSPGPKLGDFGVAYRKSTGSLAFFVVGDLGPNRKLGEGSVALHQALGNDPFVMRFGKRRARKSIGGHDVFYVLFPRSAQRGRKMDTSSIREVGGKLLEDFGGKERLIECSKK